jgi:hypothetical protein
MNIHNCSFFVKMDRGTVKELADQMLLAGIEFLVTDV